MIITFTGAFHGQAGTTTNMAALAVYLSTETKKKTILLSLQPGYNLLDRYLSGKRKILQANGAEKGAENGAGIETFRKLVKAGMADKEGMEGCVTRIGEYLDLLPGNFPSDSRRYLREYSESMSDMLDYLSEFYEMIFCDIGSGNGGMLQSLGARAALEVRNIGQNLNLIEAGLKEARELWQNQQVFYLLGCYDRQSKYSLHNLRHKYHELTGCNSGFLPYCTEIRDACSDRTLQAVLEKWRVLGIAGQYKEYYMELQKCAAKILRLLERRGEKFI